MNGWSVVRKEEQNIRGKEARNIIKVKVGKRLEKTKHLKSFLAEFLSISKPSGPIVRLKPIRFKSSSEHIQTRKR